MKRLFTLFGVMITTVALGLATIDVAEAKKGFGGGKSFGSKFSQSQSVKKGNTNSAQRSANTPTSASQQKNADRKQQLASKGGMMGMLGALAIGGLLGAMFFGGAFENINFMDILLFALIGFIIYKLLASRKKPQTQQAATAHGQMPIEPQENNQYRDNANDYGSTAAASTPAYDGQSLDELRRGIDAGFDEAAFIEGAKSCYSRMQKAWSEGDIADIRQFVTDHVFVEIQDQYQQREGDVVTEVISLNAELLSAQDLGSKQEASVLFDAQLTEDGVPTQSQEVWHFSRPNNSLKPTWFLEGIQQVED